MSVVLRLRTVSSLYAAPAMSLRITLRLSASRRVAHRIAPLIALTSSTAGSGSRSRTTVLGVGPAADERDVRAQRAVADPRLRDGLHDPGVRRAVEHDDLHRQLEPLLDGGLDRRGEPGGVVLAALEEHVAARDVGRDVREPELLEADLQIGHLDERPAADVDASEQRDVPHRRQPTRGPPGDAATRPGAFPSGRAPRIVVNRFTEPVDHAVAPAFDPTVLAPSRRPDAPARVTRPHGPVEVAS